MPVTPEQAQMLTTLALAIRPHGAPRWDASGVMAAIRKVAHLSLADVMQAVRNAADDRDLDTPGAIGNPQAPCWADRRRDRPQPPEPYDPRSFCGICGQPEHRCRRNTHSGHQFTSAVEVTRRARKHTDRRTEESA